MSVRRKSLGQTARDFEAWYKAGNGHGATAHHRLAYQRVPDWKEHGISEVLDIGCGRGILPTELEILGFRTTCTEIVPALLDRDLKNHACYPVGVEDLPWFFKEGEFHLVTMTQLLDYLRDEEQARLCVREALRTSSCGIWISIDEKQTGDMVQVLKSLPEWDALIREEAGESALYEVRYDPCGVQTWMIWKA